MMLNVSWKHLWRLRTFFNHFVARMSLLIKAREFGITIISMRESRTVTDKRMKKDE